MPAANRLAELVAADPFAAQLGVSLVTADPVTVVMPVTATHHNFYDTTHGGAVFSVADIALGLAASADGTPAAAIDGYLTLTAATSAGDVLTATVEEVTKGRTLATYRVTVTRADGRVAATLTGTVRRD
jgi:acyl-CoA thioesterase